MSNVVNVNYLKSGKCVTERFSSIEGAEERLWELEFEGHDVAYAEYPVVQQVDESPDSDSWCSPSGTAAKWDGWNHLEKIINRCKWVDGVFSVGNMVYRWKLTTLECKLASS